MKKNKHYTSNSFEFFKEVRSTKRKSKKDPHYRVRLDEYDGVVSSNYEDYDKAFEINKLAGLSASETSGQISADLVKMYSYDNSKIQNLKHYLLTNEEGRTHNTCLNCGIGEANTFDHFLPIGEFPFFSVHPKNLIPSCSNCNSKKSTNWKSDGSVLFINFYKDDIPELQFLFCRVLQKSTYFKVEFYIENIHNIDPDMFNVIDSHFDRLNICSRLNQFCNDTISEFVNEYMPYKNGRIDDFIDQVNNSLYYHNRSFGVNHWKNVLKSSLISSSVFKSYLTSTYP